MADSVMQGIYPILLTPFDDDGRIDEESLISEVDFNLNAGVHGLGLALGSEFLKMTEAERQRVTKVVVDHVRGRVPVVVNTGAQSNVAAALYSKQAEELGAAAVMCMPPSMGVSGSEMRSYFKAISDAVRVPVWIQDTSYVTVPAGVIRQIAEESERVRFAKIESPPNPLQVEECVQQAGHLVTVFGGSAGTYFIEELRRGGVGTMPWPSTPEVFVKIWNQWQAGDQSRRADDVRAGAAADPARLLDGPADGPRHQQGDPEAARRHQERPRPRAIGPAGRPGRARAGGDAGAAGHRLTQAHAVLGERTRPRDCP